MKVSAFDFHLPEECIALRPARPRDSAKLLQVSGQGEFTDHVVSDLPSLLSAGDVLVLNETKVLRAALTAIRPARAHGGGGDVKVDVNLHTAISDNEWRAFVRPAKRLRDGDEVHFSILLIIRQYMPAKMQGLLQHQRQDCISRPKCLQL